MPRTTTSYAELAAFVSLTLTDILSPAGIFNGKKAEPPETIEKISLAYVRYIAGDGCISSLSSAPIPISKETVLEPIVASGHVGQTTRPLYALTLSLTISVNTFLVSDIPPEVAVLAPKVSTKVLDSPSEE